MRTHEVGGATYAEAFPNGARMAVFPDGKVDASWGPVTPCDKGDRWLRQAVMGSGGRIAGVVQHPDETGEVFEWTGAAWESRGQSYGNNATLYSAAGQLIVVRRDEPPTYAQGWRYIADNGLPVAAWETYNDRTEMSKARGLVNLWQWVEHGNVVIGQGETGVVAVIGGKHYRIGEGHTTFVRFHREGENLAVAWWREKPNPAACFLWVTPAEIVAHFPLVGQQPPPVDDKPEDQSVEPIAPNQHGVVRRVFAAHPEIDRINDATRGRAVDYVCVELNGTSDKPWGRKARRADGGDKNTDGLAFLRPDGLFEIIDIIDGNHGGATWDHKGVFKQGENGFWAPAEPVDVPEDDLPPPVDEPEDPEDPEEESQLLAILHDIVARLERIEKKPGGGGGCACPVTYEGHVSNKLLGKTTVILTPKK